MRLRHAVVAAAMLLSVSGAVLADGPQIPAQKRAEIEKLLKVTGTLELSQRLSTVMVAQLTSVLRAAHPNIPQKALDALPEVVNGVIAEHMGAFKESVVQIYDEHLTLEELKGLNQFYATDLGRRVLKVLPAIVQESMVAGQKWGQSLGPEIAQRLRERFQKENVAL